MRGSVIKRGNRYAVKLELPPDPATGRRRQKWHSGYQTRKAAELARTQLLSELDRGRYQEPTRETTESFLERWMDGYGTRVRRSTFDGYRRILQGYVIPRIGRTRLTELRVTDLNALYTDLMTSGGRDGAELAAKTVRNVHIVLHRALDDAVRWGVLVRNPADHANIPRVRRSPRPTWTAEQTRTFLDTVADNELAAAWMLLATTGMRRGEALGLRWQDIDWNGSRISIRQQLTTSQNRAYIDEPKSAAGRRSIPIPARVLAALRQRRAAQAEHRLLLGSGWPAEHDLVFTNPDGTWIHPDTFSRQFQQHLRTAGLPRIRLHDLRHTWATLALENDVHLKVVSDHLGHSTIAITGDLYSHVAPSLAEQAVDTVSSQILSEPPNPPPQANAGDEPSRPRKINAPSGSSPAASSPPHSTRRPPRRR